MQGKATLILAYSQAILHEQTTCHALPENVSWRRRSRRIEPGEKDRDLRVEPKESPQLGAIRQNRTTARINTACGSYFA